MSRMVTTCANCRQTLAVTAADLRVGQGYVRCGRCDKVFNALLTLAEDEPPPTEPDSVAHGTRSMPVLDHSDPVPGLEEDPLPFGPTDEDEVEVVQTHASGSFRSIVLEGERGAARLDEEEDAPDALEEDGAAPASGARADAETDAKDGADADTDVDADADADTEAAADALEAEVDAGVEAGTGNDPAPAPADAGHEVSLERADAHRAELGRNILRRATSQPIDELLEEPPAGPAEDFDADLAVGNPRPASRWWHAVAVVLALLLGAQLVHHNRHALVTVPWLSGPLQAVYGLAGRSVEPPWDLRRYEVRLLGDPEAGEDARLTLQAAIAVATTAGWPQPPPVLRVLLADRWGNEVSRVDVPPREWTLGEIPRRLTPGQRVDARVSLPLPGQVSGVTVLPCLPDDAGGIHCRE